MSGKRILHGGTLFLGVFATAILYDAWAGWQWCCAQGTLEAANRELANCEDLSRQIALLRQAPAKIDETAQSREALAKLVESAALGTGVPSDHIVHVAPAQPRRVGDSPYLEQATSIELREVTLRQLIEFTQSVSRMAPRLDLSSTTIRTPPADTNPTAGRELWNVELVLTARIYAPKMPPSP